ncbi:hypothetical protein Lal_00013057, partial [Lupinus albus]
MWDTLQVTHEGTSEVKRARLNALTHEYELFRMLPSESICDMQKRFTHIVNHLVALDKSFARGELTNKVLRCLDRKWQPKVTAIVESKDLDSMPLATLFGKLQEHEMELGRLTMHEDSDRKKKNITLKATTSKSKEDKDDDESDSDLDDETMNLLVRKFSKFIKRKGGFKKFQKKEAKESTNKGKNNKDRFTCHECGKAGHMRFQSPTYLKKVDSEKSTPREFKSNKAYIVWDVPEEETTSSTSSEEESAKLCLMVSTSEVKRARLNALTHEYELFRMLPSESICDMQKRFTHIVNHLVALDKSFARGELTNKVLRCLDRKWQPKVTAIVESKDLDSMPLATLFGKLQEHEMELGRLTMHEDSDRKKKNITLKATTSKSKEDKDDDESDSDLDDETMNLLVRKFSKFIKRKGGFKKFQKKEAKESTNKGKNNKDRFTCHECGKAGHMRFQSPTYLKKVDSEKSTPREFKSKKAYIVWDVPEEETTSSTSSEEESAKLCLM